MENSVRNAFYYNCSDVAQALLVIMIAFHEKLGNNKAEQNSEVLLHQWG